MPLVYHTDLQPRKARIRRAGLYAIPDTFIEKQKYNVTLLDLAHPAVVSLGLGVEGSLYIGLMQYTGAARGGGAPPKLSLRENSWLRR